MQDSFSLSSSFQDYLEAILALEEDKQSVRITDIANRLGVAKASVNQMVSKLKDAGLIKQQAYGPVQLTDHGRELAARISMRHSKLSRFLTDVLGVDRQTAEKDACLMEHAVSPQTMEKLTVFLRNNGYLSDDCETERDCDIMVANAVALSDLKEGQKGRVVKVLTKGTIRRRIMEMGIITGTEILVKGFAPLGDPMELGIKGYNLSLRRSEAKEIMVEIDK